MQETIYFTLEANPY